MAGPRPMAVEDDIAAQIRISDAAPSHAVPVLTSQAPAGPAGPSFSAPAKLEPFLLLAKSTKGAGAAKLVEQATAAPGIFVFGELLDLPNIRELATSESHKKYYNLLELFASGTYKQYLAAKDTVPTLSENQITKLKQLSLLSLASESRTLPYDLLKQELDVQHIRELEDLIIEAIYAGLVQGRLDQRSSRFSVDSVASRDVSPRATQPLAYALGAWAGKIQQTILMLDEKIDTARAEESHKQKVKGDQSQAITRLLTELANENKSSFGSAFTTRHALPSQAQAYQGTQEPSQLTHKNAPKLNLSSFANAFKGSQPEQRGAPSDMDLDDDANGTRRSFGFGRGNRKRNRP